jgi:hypothetical protein
MTNVLEIWKTRFDGVRAYIDRNPSISTPVSEREKHVSYHQLSMYCDLYTFFEDLRIVLGFYLSTAKWAGICAEHTIIDHDDSLIMRKISMDLGRLGMIDGDVMLLEGDSTDGVYSVSFNLREEDWVGDKPDAFLDVIVALMEVEPARAYVLE